MDILLTFVLPAVLFLALEFFWCRPARLQAGTPADRWSEPAPVRFVDPLALAFVQYRLDVLAAELQRLDDDHSIFARAFRTQVAQSAYQALLADAVRLGDAWRLAGTATRSDLPRSESTIVELESFGWGGSLQEELEV